MQSMLCRHRSSKKPFWESRPYLFLTWACILLVILILSCSFIPSSNTQYYYCLVSQSLSIDTPGPESQIASSTRWGIVNVRVHCLLKLMKNGKIYFVG